MVPAMVPVMVPVTRSGGRSPPGWCAAARRTVGNGHDGSEKPVSPFPDHVLGVRDRIKGAVPSKTTMPSIEAFALIIGAMKSGTTSLYDHLVAHPQIAACRIKEPSFFGTRRWERGAKYYRGLWPDYDPDMHAYAMEASSDYTKLPMRAHTALRIAAFPARFRFLYIVRDPVERIESHIAHNIATGRLTRMHYAHALEQATHVSRYAFQLDSFRAALHGQEVLVLDFDMLRRAPQALLARCVAYLGIDPDFAFPARPPSNTRKRINGSEAFRLSDAERRRLQDELRPDMMRFSDTYAFDISNWSF